MAGGWGFRLALITAAWSNDPRRARPPPRTATHPQPQSQAQRQRITGWFGFNQKGSAIRRELPPPKKKIASPSPTPIAYLDHLTELPELVLCAAHVFVRHVGRVVNLVKVKCARAWITRRCVGEGEGDKNRVFETEGTTTIQQPQKKKKKKKKKKKLSKRTVIIVTEASILAGSAI